MTRKTLILTFLTIILISVSMLTSCSSQQKNEVVIYTSVDQVFSEPILKSFEKETGIKVLPVYDVEAAKTTGLVNRVIAEKSSPKADVFWSGEFAQTIMLKEENTLAQYKSPNCQDIQKQYIDNENYWTGFGGRARVLLVNKNLLKQEDYPKSINDLLNEKYPANKIGIAYPMFGTTATHSAALYAQIGQENGKKFFQSLKNRGVKVVDGNSVVRDMVVSGQLVMGLTDTDDAGSAIKKGEPVEMLFMDQDANSFGTLIIPNTVAVIKNGPNTSNANKLVDYILSKDIEEKLTEAGWFDMTTRSSISGKSKLDVKGMQVDLNDIYKFMDISKKDMQEIFVR